ncbi:unnamed protein product [marine sediment metagenome]|uniref:Uncharacterized protein n=1 Tax=marine sediment metagenome TaxID=412755 RepID=X1A216_9ZZZZ
MSAPCGQQSFNVGLCENLFDAELSLYDYTEEALKEISGDDVLYRRNRRE